MIRLGITGGMGCGKSEVLGLLERRGFNVCSSDEIVARLLREDKEVRAALAARFGKKVLNAELPIVDKKALADIVFNSLEQLQWLEALLHPRVLAEWENAVKARPQENWALEIPLLSEKKLEKCFDFTLCVSSSYLLQLERLTAKNYSLQEIQRRIAHQMPLEEKMGHSDFVLSNEGSLSFIDQQISILLQLLLNAFA